MWCRSTISHATSKPIFDYTIHRSSLLVQRYHHHGVFRQTRTLASNNSAHEANDIERPAFLLDITDTSGSEHSIVQREAAWTTYDGLEQNVEAKPQQSETLYTNQSLPKHKIDNLQSYDKIRNDGSSVGKTDDGAADIASNIFYEDAANISTHDLHNSAGRQAENHVEQKPEEADTLAYNEDFIAEKTIGTEAGQIQPADLSSHVYNYSMGRLTYVAMVQALRKLRGSGLPDRIEPSEGRGARLSRTAKPRGANVQTLQALSKMFKRTNRGRTYDENYLRLLQERRKLPVQRASVRANLKHCIEKNDVVVLVSATGSGKTTQLPQLLLDWKLAEGRGAFCKILCTQPRRLAAISIAERVAKEQGTYVGGHVGYCVRFDTNLPQHHGSIAYWTVGVLLKMLRDDPDAVIDTYTHLVIDEVHERDLRGDLVLAGLRDLMRSRLAAGKPFPKVVLMSATIDALKFEKYFAEPYQDVTFKVASLEIPGRNHHVEVRMLDDIMPSFEEHSNDSKFVSLMAEAKKYLEAEDNFVDKRLPGLSSSAEDVDANPNSQLQDEEVDARVEREDDESVPLSLITATIAHVLKSSTWGDVLVFLPGIAEIDKIKTRLQANPLLGLDFNDASKIRIYKLHASLYETNEEVFETVPPDCRRVILSTNIAQTSITLPDVVHVIDPGKRRHMLYHSHDRTNHFKCSWIDKAASKQRMGRAGRTQPGNYWALFTQVRHESLDDAATPEIQSTDLTSICLTIHDHSGEGSLKAAIARCMDAPDSASVDLALRYLKGLRALTETEEVTPLGKFAAWLPLPPGTARALLLGALFRAFSPLLTVAGHNPEKPLVYDTVSLQNQMLASIRLTDSMDDDKSVYLSAFKRYHAAVTSGNFDMMTTLRSQSVKENAYREMINIIRQLLGLLSDYRLVPKSASTTADPFEALPPHMDANATSSSFVKSIALTTQYANLGVWNNAIRSFVVNGVPVFVRPFSLNGRLSKEALDKTHQGPRDGELLSYSLMMYKADSKMPSLVDTTRVTPLMAMLFGASIEIIDEHTIELDGWLKYRISLDGRDKIPFHDAVSPSELVLEFRRTLDRLIQLACSELQNARWTKKNHDQHLTATARNGPISMFAEDNVMTREFAQDLKYIIETDDRHQDAACVPSHSSRSKPKKRYRPAKKWAGGLAGQVGSSV